NLLWGNPNANESDIEQAARSAHIHQTILTLPHQYDSLIEQRGKNLSGGQRQRIAIARALIGKPDILLLDDCTSALDAQTEQALLAELTKQDCTTVLVTQKTATAQHANLILLLSEGRLVDCGHHTALLQRSSLYRQIHDSQHTEENSSHGG
ncbi:MAG: ATP-binding cassette domain-containing protein, partial [Oxalicibacterium faecigallinarum]|uniref:ATP-binding cassette domain-containing protein n=1 Tax=Oxalicibacterium faecigallinarum TaxID=573741 RepID=UPI00280730FE